MITTTWWILWMPTSADGAAPARPAAAASPPRHASAQIRDRCLEAEENRRPSIAMFYAVSVRDGRRSIADPAANVPGDFALVQRLDLFGRRVRPLEIGGMKYATSR